MAVADDFSAQRGYLVEMGQHIGGRRSVPADRIGNEDRLIQFCFGHRQLLASNNFAIPSDMTP